MDVLQPIKELGKWLFVAVFRQIWSALSKLPVKIADSPKLMRLVILNGLAALSLLLVFANVHVTGIYNSIADNEARNKEACRAISQRIDGAIKIAEATEWMIRHSANADVATLLTMPWIKTSEIAGATLISPTDYSSLFGKLDSSVDSRQWEDIRWAELRNRIASDIPQSPDTVTLFLGIERLFRPKEYFNSGRGLTGSLIIARAWPDPQVHWRGVATLLPIQSFNDALRLGQDQYDSGNYDYLVEETGFLLAHPNPAVVYGTDPNGRHLKGASNSAEVGKYPVNTRDSDWIAGSAKLTDAFGAMIRHQPKSVVYTNLQGRKRLTSFRLVEIQNMKGKSIGVVTGRSLNWLEALTAPFLLSTSSSLKTVLWSIAGIYVAALSVWLLFASHLRSVHLDIIAWSRFMTSETACRLGLLPIVKNRVVEYNFSNTVAIVISFDFSHLNRPKRDALVDKFSDLCARLRIDGWVTHIWSVRSVIACRLLTDVSNNGQPYFWSPTNVVDYLNRTEEFQTMRLRANTLDKEPSRVVYGIGDLQIRAGRTEDGTRARITVFGSIIPKVINSSEELGAYRSTSGTVLMYPIEEAVEAGLQVVGDKVTVNSRMYGTLQFADSTRAN